MSNSASLKDLIGILPEPERRPSLAEEVAKILREQILLGKLPPGHQINEREISEYLNVSRTPLREAIRQLETEGLIEYGNTRRLFIANPTMETIAQWLDIQGALEALAGELACKHATQIELDNIASLQDQMVDLAESEDQLELFELDMKFHKAIVAAAHNPPLIETHNQFNARLWRARFLSSQRQSNRRIQTQKHQDIVDALLRRDTKHTAATLKKHLQNAVGNIEVALKKRSTKGEA